ncbi:uncharacterized protein LOC131641153 [Vicia villosa]|uniref:uncharacterized protein LOC131641153 n=1 Tax=Vicia villosa TaxID=3911 RepID=UPI00273C3EB9|nr:uncharacterized protein LOC131641153 [Vicia villosa]
MDLIQAAGLLKTVVHLSKCYEMLVKEFIVNLTEDCAAKRSKEFRKVFVRGKCVNFFSTVLNNLLGRFDEAQPELEVSNNKFTVSTILGRFIYVVGTKAKFDYGTYIFEKTMKHVGSYSVKGPIAFPSLICDIILNQHPGILVESDSICKRGSALSFHYKLFQGTHVPDIVMTSAETSKSGSSASKAEVIAMLKETCKELEARKISLEKMISNLEKDGNEDFAGAAGIEAQDEQEDGRDSEEVVE